MTKRTCTLHVKQLMLLDTDFAQCATADVNDSSPHPLPLPHSLFLGTVFNDVDKKGCIAVEKCPCVHNRKAYQPGESYKKACKEW